MSVGPAEVIVILVVALIVLGPTRLPEAARQVGRAVAEFRRMSSGFQAELRDAFADPISDPVANPRAGPRAGSIVDPDRQHERQPERQPEHTLSPPPPSPPAAGGDGADGHGSHRPTAG